MEKIELTVLRNFLINESYSRKVLPFIKDEYFELRSEKIIFQEIHKFITEYNKMPTKEILGIEVDNEMILVEMNSVKLKQLSMTLLMNLSIMNG